MLQTVFSRATRNIVVGSCLAFLLTACLEDNKDGLTSTANVVTDSRVSGSVGDGPIAGASMQVLRNDGQELATFESDARANYDINVSTEERYYPLQVTANGGTDLVTNQTPDFELLGAVFRPSNQNVANVNPFSTIAYLLAEEMSGGVTEANLQAAEAVVSTQLNSGLDSLASSGPMTTHINETNIAEIVKASEALAETIRRTRDLMTGAGFPRNADQVIAAISSDLTDNVVDGRGGSGADPRTAAIATLVYAQVLLESMANQLRVNGSDATSAMESAIEQVSIRAATTRLDGLSVTGSMVTKARIGLAAAFAFDSRTSLSELHTAVSGLQAGMNPSLVRTLLPSDYRTSMDSTLVALAGADAATIDMINGIARGNGDIAPGNRAPTIQGMPAAAVEVGSSYSFTPGASDADGDALTFSVANMPAWASFNTTTGQLAGTPAAGDIGTYPNIVISVSDSELTVDLAAFSIEVFQGNVAPSISGTPATNIVAGQSYVFQPTATDANGDDLTFSINNQPAWMSFNPMTGRLSGAPFESDVGTYANIVISVSDSSLSDSLSAFTITVETAIMPNTPPDISGNAPGQVNAGDNYSFTPSASDADGDSLTFSISNQPSWATFNTANGSLTGTPGDGDVGSYSNIRITVSDGTDTASLGFSITVAASDNSTPIDVTFSVSATTGVIPLEVNFSASQYPEINEYRWDFGDGSAAVGPVQTHTFTEAGAYTVTLTATLDDGTQRAAQRNIDAFSSINNTDVIIPGTALFFDSFEYTADRDDAGVVSIFQDHGWTTVKSQQTDPDGNPLGYIYTTDTVPGYEGGMLPGAGSDRVLVMEALPTTLGFYEGPNTFWGNMQTDFYLQMGAASAPAGTIPADVWFQFWLYTSGGTTGGYDRKMKFLYPCNGNYGCDSESWKVLLGSSSYHPNWVELSSSGEPVPDAFVHVSGNTAVWTPGQFAEGRLGHTDASELIMGGRWVLVKLHIDTSGPQGVFEAWLKPLGGTEVKVAEHLGGVTPGFEWPVSDHSGHRVLRMPSTIGSQNVVDLYPQSYDVTFYMDDFTMATSEDDLPRYPY